jgi:hypothetical protein
MWFHHGKLVLAKAGKPTDLGPGMSKLFPLAFVTFRRRSMATSICRRMRRSMFTPPSRHSRILRTDPFLLDLLRVHDQFIIDNVPKERLLLMRLEEGWEPLCKFLGRPIPSELFPHANDSASADSIAAYMMAMYLVRWTLLLGTAAMGVYGTWRYATG